MKLHQPGLVGWLLLGLGMGCAAALTTEVRGPEAGPNIRMQTMLSLASELHADMEAGQQLSAGFTAWCAQSKQQWTSLSDKLQRRLDRTEALQRQAKADERRLSNELQVATQELGQQEQLLKDASATTGMASTELSAEQQEVNRALQASDKAAGLLNVQTELRAGQGTEFDTDSPTQLLQALTDMTASLKEERTAVSSEDSIAQEKLQGFVARMNSSLTRLQSQVAAVDGELAHRKREASLLERKFSELQSILLPALVSKNATEEVCTWRAKAASILEKQTDKDLHAVKAVLGQTSLAAMNTAPAFLQMRSAQEAGMGLVSDDKVASQNIMDDLTSLSALVPEAQDDEARHATAAEVEQGGDSEMKKWCSNLHEAAQADANAVHRSKQRLEEQLAVANGTAHDHKDDSMSYSRQQDVIKTQLHKLDELASHELSNNGKIHSSLHKSLAHLQMALSHDTQDAEATKAMIQTIENHLTFRGKVHASLQHHTNLLHKRAKVVLDTLEGALKLNSQESSGYASEVQLLATLSRAKQDDQMLSKSFQALLVKLCPLPL
mmetsp:Transcript_8555/g.15309  ORF Transcript_8555/g.15309 Transcript_8555/m.15309 type:complete len:553 (+) Transcript_8555:36-1694(+)